MLYTFWDNVEVTNRTVNRQCLESRCSGLVADSKRVLATLPDKQMVV